mgnify:CR=1 FL=1
MRLSIRIEEPAWVDMTWWAKHEPKIFELISNAAKNPFSGLGKPEALKGNWKGYWSRRINQEHRLVYKVTTEEIIIMAAKGHYQ